MTANKFKYAGTSVVIIDESGMVYEADAFRDEFDTLDDFTNFVNGYDMQSIVRVLILDPFKDKPYDSAQTVHDVTNDVIDHWLIGVDVLSWDEDHGKPAGVSDRLWEELLEEARAEADDHERMTRDPMTYHFGKGWHGVKTGGF